MAWSTKEEYYSGQGVVLVGRRDAAGKPKGLRPVGNVPNLAIQVQTSVLEHKESTTGQRGTDLRLTTETKCNMNFTLENFNSQNLADAMRGDYNAVAGATLTDQAGFLAYPGSVTALGKLNVSAVTIKMSTTALTLYTNDLTPYDYKLNSEAGSVEFNDGSVVAVDKLGVVVTAVAVGSTTVLTVPNKASVGDKVTLKGFTGSDAAFVNGNTYTVTARTDASLTLGVDTTGKTITTAAGTKAVFPGMAFTATMTFPDQVQVEALTQGADDLYMRFEGLNTADDNTPVVVEVFRFQTDPLKELSLISDQVQQFVLEGSVLADVTRPTGSKYFNVQKLT